MLQTFFATPVPSICGLISTDPNFHSVAVFSWHAEAAQAGVMTVSGCDPASVGDSQVAIFAAATENGAYSCVGSGDQGCGADGAHFLTTLPIVANTWYRFAVTRYVRSFESTYPQVVLSITQAARCVRRSPPLGCYCRCRC